MEDKIFVLLVILINSFQLFLVLIVGLLFGCLYEIIILSTVFWVLRAFIQTKHFNPSICTIITVLYYVVASFLIRELYLIQFMPIILGLALILITKER